MERWDAESWDGLESWDEKIWDGMTKRSGEKSWDGKMG